MYLSPAGRAACFLLLLVTLLLLLGAAGLVFGAGGGQDRTDRIAGGVTMCVFAGLTGIGGVAFLRYVFSEASRKALQPDILAGTLAIPRVAERRGVQWALVPMPDRLRAPSYFILAVFLQNAHSRPRGVSVTVRGASGPHRIRLEGGEVGVLRICLLLSAAMPAGPRQFRVDVDARKLEKVGKRVIDRSGLSPRSSWEFRNVGVEVIGSHAGPPANAQAVSWQGYARLCVGGVRPDLEPLRLLEELGGAE